MNKILARLVREAGKPSVVPDPLYAETLRSRILDRVGPEESIISWADAVRKVGGLPALESEQKKAMIINISTKPVEEDLVNVLRLVVEYNHGAFPDSIGTNKNMRRVMFYATLQPENDSQMRVRS
jgi:hypothetical protein